VHLRLVKELKLMSEVRSRLEELRSQPVESPADARIVEEAARLLGELADVETRARRWTEEIANPTRGEGLAGLPLRKAARRVLEEAGVPLHARELGARIKARGWRHPRSPNAPEGRIMFQLAALLPRHPDLFRRVGPNTFALAEWEDGPIRKRPAPRLGLFRGPGRAIGRSIGESEDPLSEELWRSS
jgi:hypothetical protein